MRLQNMSRSIVVLLVVALIPFVADCDDDTPLPDGGPDADADSDADADAGTDADADSDSDTDADSDADADAGADADHDSDPDAALLVPAVFRTPDSNAVCGPTPAEHCTPADMAWVESEYGSTYQRADEPSIAAAGLVFRLVEFAEREGPSNIDVIIVDQAGEPLPGVAVAFSWPDAPDLSRPDEWYPRKITSVTDVAGRVGFALGGGAYLDDCGGGGPHAIWVSEPGVDPETTQPSDLADRLGMLGGTNHRHLDLLFQRVETANEPIDATRCPLF